MFRERSERHSLSLKTIQATAGSVWEGLKPPGVTREREIQEQISGGEVPLILFETQSKRGVEQSLQTLPQNKSNVKAISKPNPLFKQPPWTISLQTQSQNQIQRCRTIHSPNSLSRNLYLTMTLSKNNLSPTNQTEQEQCKSNLLSKRAMPKSNLPQSNLNPKRCRTIPQKAISKLNLSPRTIQNKQPKNTPVNCNGGLYGGIFEWEQTRNGRKTKTQTNGVEEQSLKANPLSKSNHPKTQPQNQISIQEQSRNLYLTMTPSKNNLPQRTIQRKQSQSKRGVEQSSKQSQLKLNPRTISRTRATSHNPRMERSDIVWCSVSVASGIHYL